MKKNHKKVSKFLSLLLRHQPQKLNLQLDEGGWVDVEELLTKLQKNGHDVNLSVLKEVVAKNDKQRFSFNQQGTKIRANQGHSIKIDLGYKPIAPPDTLYHGTVSRFLENIQEKGLLKMQRHHVHLSQDLETAQNVGSRRGKAIILKINTAMMQQDGYEFFQSENGVWLTEIVPPKYIEFPD